VKRPADGALRLTVTVACPVPPGSTDSVAGAAWTVTTGGGAAGSSEQPAASSARAAPSGAMGEAIRQSVGETRWQSSRPRRRRCLPGRWPGTAAAQEAE
jgi:hypothetical protein